MTLSDFATRLDKARSKTFMGVLEGYVARCPNKVAHSNGDSTLSFGCWLGDDGFIHVKCQKGCSEDEILGAMSLSQKDRDARGALPSNEPEAVYRYDDDQGRYVFEKQRFRLGNGKKDFRLKTRNADGSLCHNLQSLDGWRKWIYNLPAVLEAVKSGQTIYINEGEKACDLMTKMGFVATCQSVGADKSPDRAWLPVHSQWLRGAKSVVIVADRDDVGAIYARHVAASLGQTVGFVQIVQSKTEGDKDDAYDHLQTYGVGDFVPLQAKTSGRKWLTMDSVTTKAQEWLIRPYIPIGEYTVVAGMPGVGKSTLIQQIATHVTTGTPIMGADVVQGAVAFLSAEQGLQTVTVPRFREMGADLSKIMCPDEESSDGKIIPYVLDAAGADDLYENIKGKGVRLLVVDTGDKYFEAQKSPNNQVEVREWLNRLIAIARREELAVIVTMHLNKAYGMDPLNRIAGSVAWGGAARSGILCGRDPDDDKRCAMTHIKANCGPRGKPLGYFIEDRGGDIGHFGWCETDLTAERMCEAPQTQEMRDRKKECEVWLKDLLTAQTVVPSKEIESLAKKEGFSHRNLWDAKKGLGVKAEKDGLIGGWSWFLPTEESQEVPHWAE